MFFYSEYKINLKNQNLYYKFLFNFVKFSLCVLFVNFSSYSSKDQEIFSLENNNFSEISFYKMVDLANSYLSEDDIKDISLKFHTDLKSLNISSNQIQDISFIKKCTSLTRLDLSNNHLKEDISGIQPLSSLTYLNLSRNCLTTEALKTLMKLPSLSTLDCSFMKIGDEEAKIISNITTLKNLFLKSTKITLIGLNNLTKLKNLEVLDVSNNFPKIILLQSTKIIGYNDHLYDEIELLRDEIKHRDTRIKELESSPYELLDLGKKLSSISINEREKDAPYTPVKPQISINTSSPHTKNLQDKILAGSISKISIDNRNLTQGLQLLTTCIEKSEADFSIIFDRKSKDKIMSSVAQPLTTLLRENKVIKLVLGTFPEHKPFFESLLQSKVEYIKVFGICTASDQLKSSFYLYFPKNLKTLVLGKGYNDSLKEVLKNLPSSLSTLRLRASTMGREHYNLIMDYIKNMKQLDTISLNLNGLPKDLPKILFKTISESNIKKVSFSSIKTAAKDHGFINDLDEFVNSKLVSIKIKSLKKQANDEKKQVSKEDFNKLKLLEKYDIEEPQEKTTTDSKAEIVYTFKRK